MKIHELIEELENAQKEKGPNADVFISYSKPIGNGMSEQVKLNILDIIYSPESDPVGIWAD